MRPSAPCAHACPLPRSSVSDRYAPSRCVPVPGGSRRSPHRPLPARHLPTLPSARRARLRRPVPSRARRWPCPGLRPVGGAVGRRPRGSPDRHRCDACCSPECFSAALTAGCRALMSCPSYPTRVVRRRYDAGEELGIAPWPTRARADFRRCRLHSRACSATLAAPAGDGWRALAPRELASGCTPTHRDAAFGERGLIATSSSTDAEQQGRRGRWRRCADALPVGWAS